MLTKNHLNLARKWRPQSFDQIVGQLVTTRILKNSLYLKKYFPVYLFAGQRGCGKTTTARIFAAALNCHQLTTFQEQPTSTSIPCLSCPSCLAMTSGHHPDFIEIDAASHTGVDNVRQIIENSSYVPLLGQKKIYLIDEAHMLSKAAFNAFLKLLEEPADTVLFILATTELNKIPQTVLSRCFQLSFTSLDHASLKAHLQTICSHEGIACDDEALDIIIEETDGSARDALNLLEQTRFSTENITVQSLYKVLGKVSNTIIIALFEQIINKNPTALLTTFQSIAHETIIPQQIWNSFIDLCQAILWLKYGVETLPNSFHKNFDALYLLAGNCSLHQLHAIMQFLWQQEPLFLQTSKKQIFLEATLLQLCQQTMITDIEALTESLQTAFQEQKSYAPPILPPTTLATPPHATEIIQQPPVIQHQPEEKKTDPSWDLFIQKLTESNKDLLLNSILLQAHFQSFDQETGIITLSLSSKSKFFKDKLEECRDVITPLILPFFSQFKNFVFKEGTHSTTTLTQPQTLLQKEPYQAPSNVRHHDTTTTQKSDKSFVKRDFNTSFNSKKEKNNQFEAFDVSDKQKWPLANLILNHFPGKIKKVNFSN